MELKIEKLFGEDFAGKPTLPREERREERPVSYTPIADSSVVFAALRGALRRRESAVSFLEIRRDFFIRVLEPVLSGGFRELLACSPFSREEHFRRVYIPTIQSEYMDEIVSLAASL